MYKEYLKLNLSQERYEHCLRTEKMAEKLCKLHNVNTIAITAALLHDVAKELSLDEMINLLSEDEIKEAKGLINKSILHGFAGAKLAKKVFNIENKELISAIKYHTIGKAHMSDVEKVVYISDAIEEGRMYPNVNEIRNKVYESLDDGILEELNYKIKYLIYEKRPIHPNAIEFRNSLMVIK